MSAPRVFMSSTIEDLRDIREKVGKFILSLGYDPVRWEIGSVSHDPVNRRGAGGGPVESAIKEVQDSDITVVIVGRRYGYIPADGRPASVTEREYEVAIASLIPVYAYVDRDVLNEYNNYFKANRDASKVTYKAETGVHIFIERMYEEEEVSVLVHPFTSALDITEHLRQQWGSLFRLYLEEKRLEALGCKKSAAVKNISTPGNVCVALRANKFVRFSLESVRDLGAVKVTEEDIIGCLLVSNDLQTYRREVRRRFGHELMIDRTLTHRAEEEYKSAMRIIALESEGGIDYGLGV